MINVGVDLTIGHKGFTVLDEGPDSLHRKGYFWGFPANCIPLYSTGCLYACIFSTNISLQNGQMRWIDLCAALCYYYCSNFLHQHIHEYDVALDRQGSTFQCVPTATSTEHADYNQEDYPSTQGLTDTSDPLQFQPETLRHQCRSDLGGQFSNKAFRHRESSVLMARQFRPSVLGLDISALWGNIAETVHSLKILRNACITSNTGACVACNAWIVQNLTQLTNIHILTLLHFKSF